MMCWLRRLIALIIALVLAVFAVVNREPVLLRFWPLDRSATMPVSVAILIGAAIGFLLGAAMVWGPSLAARLRLRDAQARLRLLAPPPAPARPSGTALVPTR